jgi:peptidoglycan/xylan/chitin deacetylase (PgdA/CDA1 family)
MTSMRDLAPYSPIVTRPPIRWPGGARLALWIVPNVEFYEFDPPPATGRETWDRVPAYPDVREYSFRDYGNRVGFWRMLELLDEYEVRATVSLNMAVLDHFPEIAEIIVDRRWGVMSHGIYNTRFLYGMSEDEERAFYRDNIDSLRRHTGIDLKGILTPAVTNTPRTPELIAEAGLLYHADWVHDDQPAPILVKGGRLISMPYSYELNDAPLWDGRPYSGDYLVDTCRRQFDRLHAEGRMNGKVMCVALHPYQIGQPHHAEALRQILAHICGRDDVWYASGDEIAEYYLDKYYDEHVRHAREVADAR